jgi:hypothetical protein
MASENVSYVETQPTAKLSSHAHIDPVPAIQPAILKQQAALLASHYSNPDAYIRSLHYLFDYYADRSRHPGMSGKPRPTLSTYKVHPAVLRSLLQELIPLTIQEPAKGLALCDALWDVPYVEFKLLAAMLLGQIAPFPLEPHIERLRDWLTPDLEFTMIKAIMENSFEKLHKIHPIAMERIIQDWLEQKNTFSKQLGLQALLALILQPDYDNLPVFFRLIQPLTCEVPAVLRPDLLDIVAALIIRSPQETAYFLRQTLHLPESRDTAWIIRQSLSNFPVEIRNELRTASRTASERKR